MRENVWIINHYATKMYLDNGGRHLWFSKYLTENNYKPVILCATTVHNSDRQIKIDKRYQVIYKNSIPFVFIKTNKYRSNGLDRIMNMINFYRNIVKNSKNIAKEIQPPDVVIGSSVHPLSLLAGLKIAKKYNVPFICEIRDLWPESIVAYKNISKNNLLIKVLYLGEKYIYKKADRIIMTWEGGKDYIVNQGWENKIEIEKISHISNGVDFKGFEENKKEFNYRDSDLDNPSIKKVLYTGSIREVNDIQFLINVAKIFYKKNEKHIKILVFGEGDQLNSLRETCKNEGLNNIIFKGAVEKKYIPSILSKADINILHNKQTILDKYGQSQNKLFEYLSAGKPIIQTYRTSYNVIERNDYGMVLGNQNPYEAVDAINHILNNPVISSEIKSKRLAVIKNFDFKFLTNQLINTIEESKKEI